MGRPVPPTVPLPIPSVPDSVFLAVSVPEALSSMKPLISVYLLESVLEPVLPINLLSVVLWIHVDLLSVQLIPMPSVCQTSVEAATLGSLMVTKKSLILAVNMHGILTV